ncbi:MAG: DNA-directed RNA polymerase subunit omega [Candidatus Omnitrophica bacterium]|nr:DNA-directed RNA polymerase subunit omega [Candidatus Omnitrophota bacterium]
MIYQPIEKLLPRSGFSSYKLIAMAFLRAQEISNGSPKLVEAPLIEKATTTAFREIIAGKVMLKSVADAAETEEKKSKKKK